jgi:hypothetical protein
MLKVIKEEVTGSKEALDDFINYYMEGNLRRFLRKHKQQWFFIQTYSRTLRKVKQSNTRSYRAIMAENMTPNKTRNVLNIFITLDKHFSIGFNIKAFEELLWVYDDLEDILMDYMFKLNSKRYANRSKNFKKFWLNSKQAIREQKARGFIDINDFDNYNPKACHLYSTVDPDLIYPYNIENWGGGKGITSPHIFASQYGVEGHTRVNIPPREKRKKLVDPKH